LRIDDAWTAMGRGALGGCTAAGAGVYFGGAVLMVIGCGRRMNKNVYVVGGAVGAVGGVVVVVGAEAFCGAAAGHLLRQGLRR